MDMWIRLSPKANFTIALAMFAAAGAGLALGGHIDPRSYFVGALIGAGGGLLMGQSAFALWLERKRALDRDGEG